MGNPRDAEDAAGAAAREVVRIRVHGVSRYEPRKLMGVRTDEEIVNVGGASRTSAFFARVDAPYEQGYLWSPLTYDARLQRFWILLWPFAVLNVAGFAHQSSRTSIRARIHHLLNEIVGVLLLASVVVWLMRIVDEGFLRRSWGPLHGQDDVIRVLIGWSVAAVTVTGLWLTARYQARRHHSLDGMGAPPRGRPSWRDWWNERPGDLSRAFWRRSTGERREARDWRDLLLIWGFLSLVWSLAAAAGVSPWDDGTLQLDGFAILLLRAQFGALVFITVVCVCDWSMKRRWSELLRCLTPAVIGALSVMGVAMTGMLLLTPFDRGNGGSRQPAPEVATLLPALIVASAVAIAVVFIAAAWVTAAGLRRAESTSRRIWRKERLARLASSAEVLLAPPVVAGTLTAAFAASSSSFPNIPFPSWMTWLWIVPLALAFAVAVWRSMRERLGVIWDVVNFWPRAFHQFAPPPYAARAVPELAKWIGDCVQENNDVHVLSHSQGSVIAYAALTRLEPPVRSRVTFTTYGSPLGTLYAKFFPAYFGASDYKLLRDDLQCRRNDHGWRNFYRSTDYIGREVFGDDLQDPDDPADVLIPITSSKVPTHGGYLDEPVMQTWLDEVHGRSIAGS